MRKFFLLCSVALGVSLFLFIGLGTQQKVYACNNDKDCSNGKICQENNPPECKICKNAQQCKAACTKVCKTPTLQQGDKCDNKTASECIGGTVCRQPDNLPTQCSLPQCAKDPACLKACDQKYCLPPPPSPSPSTGPVFCGEPCSGVSGPSGSSDCPAGTHCAGADPVHFIFGHCLPDPGTKCATPSISPAPTQPPPPSPPCAQWGSAGRCLSFATPFGDLLTNPSGFVRTIMSILLSVSGGIALLLIIKAGYQLMTSQGKPEQTQQARDQLIAAIVGLIFLVFSFIALQVIGFDILRIPGFGP